MVFLEGRASEDGEGKGAVRMSPFTGNKNSATQMSSMLGWLKRLRSTEASRAFCHIGSGARWVSLSVEMALEEEGLAKLTTL